jgi:subtilisin-like proprotein convertase family protein
MTQTANSRTRVRRLAAESLEKRYVLTQLFPDMFPWASESRGFLYDWVVEGDLLRFTTAFANMGVGHLELRGGDIVGDKQEVWQRVFNDDGTWTDYLAGTFTYHPSHGHIHFDGYAIYNLREDVGGNIGDIVATGGKISFCLIDVARYDPDAGPSQYNSCGQLQGVSAGWSDVYGRYLTDQWINIAGVPDGYYWLEVTVDPDNQLLESDETNNVTAIPVVIDRGLTIGDHLEPNNSFAEPTEYGPVGYRLEPGLSIHSGIDEDYFQFAALEDGEFEAHIKFTHSLGDLDMYVYDGAQNLIYAATSDTDNETAQWSVVGGQNYFVRVVGDNGETNGYDLELEGPGDISTVVVQSFDPALPIPIPDGTAPGQPGQTISSFLLGPDIIIDDINLMINNLTHTWLGDLQIELESPAGTRVTIVQSRFQNPSGPLGGGDNFLGTIMDDQSPVNITEGTAPYTGRFDMSHPSVGMNPLTAFNGEKALGPWTLYVTDWYEDDTGSLNSWGIEFTGDLGDPYEPNEDFAQAPNLGLLGSFFEEDLSIHTSNDLDFFRFTPAADGTAYVNILFPHASGDLTLQLYDSNLNVIAESASSTDNESIIASVVATDVYYIKVFGVAGAINDYDLGAWVTAGVRGDFNGDQGVDAADVDLLRIEIQNGTHSLPFDLTGDLLVNAADMDELILHVLDTLYGDANLDRTVDGVDFLAWNAHKFTTGGWAQGNFNLDSAVDGLDFLLWNSNKFQSTISPTSAQFPMQPPSPIAARRASVRERLAGASEPETGAVASTPRAPLAALRLVAVWKDDEHDDRASRSATWQDTVDVAVSDLLPQRT